jgi:predicted glycogen debranching enzyme
MIRIAVGPTAPGLDREWLETDGRGGYAASTLEGFHTRRYHGWIVANLPEQGGRHVLLSKLEDSLALGGEEFFFTRHRYPGVLFPPGPSILREFILDVCPRFSYRVGAVSLQKSVMLVHGTGALLIRYDLEKSRPAGSSA